MVVCTRLSLLFCTSKLCEVQAGEKPDSAEASMSGRPYYTDECTAFVRGLPQDIEDGELDEVFADCGGLKDIRITRDPQTGQAKVGFCR